MQCIGLGVRVYALGFKVEEFGGRALSFIVPILSRMRISQNKTLFVFLRFYFGVDKTLLRYG
jgi:hypothetical protein